MTIDFTFYLFKILLAGLTNLSKVLNNQLFWFWILIYWCLSLSNMVRIPSYHINFGFNWLPDNIGTKSFLYLVLLCFCIENVFFCEVKVILTTHFFIILILIILQLNEKWIWFPIRWIEAIWLVWPNWWLHKKRWRRNQFKVRFALSNGCFFVARGCHLIMKLLIIMLKSLNQNNDFQIYPRK